MPSSETKEDPRLVELPAVKCRLKTVLTFLKGKHTAESLETRIDEAKSGLGDHTSAFVQMESAMIRGTRHLGSLIQLAEALEIKAEIGQADHVLDECTALLESKVKLLKQIYGV